MKKAGGILRATVLVVVLVNVVNFIVMLWGQAERNRVENDEISAQCIVSSFKYALNDENCYKEFKKTSVREMVLTDRNSINEACEGICEKFMYEFSNGLSGLKAPDSHDAKEYYISWDVDENGELKKVECKIRLEDGTYLKNKNGEIITGVSTGE